MTVFERSAGAFVFRREGEGILFLLLMKPNGDWDLPKGHIEKGENATEAAQREIFEETGIEPKFAASFSKTTRYFFFRGRHRVSKTVKFFIAEAFSDSVSISKEHKGYVWAGYEESAQKLRFKDLVGALRDVWSYISRMNLMDALNGEYASLPGNSKTWDLSRRLVPGEGRLDAQLMLIGQAPGANEDAEGRPFVGRSGRLLDSLLGKAHIRRDQAYITSAVQFFPPANRMPTDDEVGLCRPFLARQMDLISPRYVILLGNLASTALLGIGELEKNHGRIVEKGGITYFITFHPAAALRFRDKAELMLGDLRKFAAIMKKDHS